MDNLFVVFFAVVLVVALVLFAYISQAGRSKSRLDQAAYRQRWQRIESLAAQGDSGQQLAIMEADKLVDQALRDNGYPGATMADRLKDARRTLKNNDAVWQAHKLRNRIAHEHDVRLNGIVISRALQGFKGALKDLGAL